MKPLGYIIITAVILLIAGGGLYLMFSGPRMQQQPVIKPFQARMPLPAADAVAFNTIGQSIDETNPPESTDRNLQIGQTAYTYYCAFCHGAKGDGQGPVGSSYIPKPADLTVSKVREMSDRQLYNAILTGTGHEPVMKRIIEESYRWYLVLYLRDGLYVNE